jgi:hypothetical protein
MRGVFLSLALVAPAIAPAQAVRARVLEEDGTPLPRALVELRRADGTVAARANSGRDGAFAVTAPAPGRYRLRVLAIGYSPYQSSFFELASAGRSVADVRLARVAVTLADLEVLERSRCGAGAGTVLSQLLDGARTALDVMHANLAGGDGFTSRLITREALATRDDSLITADTSAVALVRWPLAAIDPDSIRRHGFMVEGPVPGGTGYHWFGPDVRVLFADWFLATHCFRVERRAAGDSVITLTFVPAATGARVDIAGTLVLDAETLALHRLTFEHRNLPSPLRPRSAGGEVTFAELGQGWVPVSWWIHAPIVTEDRRTVLGSFERRGEVQGRARAGDGLPRLRLQS